MRVGIDGAPAKLLRQLADVDDAASYRTWLRGRVRVFIALTRGRTACDGRSALPRHMRASEGSHLCDG